MGLSVAPFQTLQAVKRRGWIWALVITAAVLLVFFYFVEVQLKIDKIEEVQIKTELNRGDR